jgi:hypothetical protein
MLSQHGTADPIVPYNYDHPFHIPMLPKLMGSYLIDKRYKDLGLRSEFESWNGYSHVPFIGGLNLDALFGTNPLAIIFNPMVLDSTKRHITNFCYSLIDCNRVSGIKENISKENLNIFPNPTTGNFTISIPKNINANKWNLEMYDITGKQVFAQQYQGNKDFISMSETLPTGLYMVKMYYEQNNENNVYVGKITIAQ